MYNLFGTKWNRLHCGPLWSVVPVMQVQASSQFMHCKPSDVSFMSTSSRNISLIFFVSIDLHLQARVNIPGLSDRTICRRIEATEMCTGPDIQVKF